MLTGSLHTQELGHESIQLTSMSRQWTILGSVSYIEMDRHDTDFSCIMDDIQDMRSHLMTTPGCVHVWPL